MHCPAPSKSTLLQRRYGNPHSSGNYNIHNTSATFSLAQATKISMCLIPKFDIFNNCHQDAVIARPRVTNPPPQHASRHSVQDSTDHAPFDSTHCPGPSKSTLLQHRAKIPTAQETTVLNILPLRCTLLKLQNIDISDSQNRQFQELPPRCCNSAPSGDRTTSTARLRTVFKTPWTMTAEGTS